MDIRLDDLVDHKRIVALDATPVPAPAHSPYPGLHLLVNCHYDIAMAEKAAADLLELGREDALHVLSRLAAGSSAAKYVSVVVTIYGHFPCQGADRPARMRIYRLNVLTEELLAAGTPITSTGLTEMHADESSELETVSELLHAAAH
ncbi:MAG TPA: hypothetical protein VGI40_03295 [Pirellulaceae bacterium]|jgi:hypothetical protein